MVPTAFKPRSRAAIRVARLGGALAVLAVLAGVFGLYRRPEFLVQLANQLWTCF